MTSQIQIKLTLKERALHDRLLLQYPSIDNFFRSKRVILSLTLKERAIHDRLLLPYPSIDNFFCSKRIDVILSLTLKERAIHVCLASLLWQYPSIDNFFRSKGVFTHLLRFLFVLASSLACFFVYTLGEICGRSFSRTRNHTLYSPLCVFVLAA